MNVCQESQNFAINMLPNSEPSAPTDQFVTRFLHVELYTGLQNFLTFDLNLGVGFYSSMGLYSRQYGTLNHTQYLLEHLSEIIVARCCPMKLLEL